jgi:hypothetical protein
MRYVSVAGGSDLYQPELSSEEDGLGQWLELAQAGLSAVAKKKQKSKAKAEQEAQEKKARKEAAIQARIDQAVAASRAGGGPSLAGFSGMWPLVIIAGVILGPSLMRMFRGR